MSDRVALKIKRFLNTCPKKREWDVVRARVFQCFSLFFHMFCVFCHLLHTFSVIFIKFIGFVSWYYLGIQLDSWYQLVLHVYICILKYRYILPRYTAIAKTGMYIYIYVHSTWYLHWWFLQLDCQVAFWLTRQFQWNSLSKGKCKFQSTALAQVIAIFFLAYFVVTCCIDAQNKAAILSIQLFGKVA